MREVAAEAGLSVRLIHYYFGTTEALLRFIMEYLARSWPSGSRRGSARRPARRARRPRERSSTRS
jgi:AcrR family transcriptional regulator